MLRECLMFNDECLMEYNRKIAPIIRRVTFEEAERADDLFWANASYAERLNTIYELRVMFGGDKPIQPVLRRRHIKDEDND